MPTSDVFATDYTAHIRKTFKTLLRFLRPLRAKIKCYVYLSGPLANSARVSVVLLALLSRIHRAPGSNIDWLSRLNIFVLFLSPSMQM
jgi:hypothetical protein